MFLMLKLKTENIHIFHLFYIIQKTHFVVMI